ncbi:hypothetical protein ABE426_16145 [Sphingobacterium faecium]|uniref:hypothetical protein n=1 Tax=Sphingobacterium faecium TaxID=34087 RepID=UPI0032088D42
MYEPYTRQALPEKQCRELLGTSICVFNANNAFIIENILNNNEGEFDWYQLIDKTSGKLKPSVKKHLTDEIYNLFENLVDRRNRIIHSFQVTYEEQQILATKDTQHHQFIITEDYLLQFIKDNEILNSQLHEFRGH